MPEKSVTERIIRLILNILILLLSLTLLGSIAYRLAHSFGAF